MRNCYQTKLGSTCLDAVKPTCCHWVVAKQARKKRKKVKSLSRVWLFVTPRTVAYQAPPSMGFSRREYWSGLPFPSPGDLPNPGTEPGSPHCRQMLCRLSHQGSCGKTKCSINAGHQARSPGQLMLKPSDRFQENIVKGQVREGNWKYVISLHTILWFGW